MTNWTKIRRSGVALLLMGGLLATTACDTEELLEVVDPELVTPDNVQGENGAVLFWAGALGEFAQGYSSGGGGIILYAGMFTDEFLLSGTRWTAGRSTSRTGPWRASTVTSTGPALPTRMPWRCSRSSFRVILASPR